MEIDAAPAIAGALLVDKPSGPTSHDVVAVVRRALKTPRVGHTGTLDPLATGLLVVLVGAATRLARFLAADEKEYVADVRLGVATPTYDAASLAEGVRYPMSESRYPMDVELEPVLARFRGSYLQMPPPYSAKKVGGVAAYERARRNQPLELKPAQVAVGELEILNSSGIGYRLSDIGTGGLLRLRVAASAGFYVRSLAHDLGQALGCGAHLEGLRRTRVGRFRVEEAVTLDKLHTGVRLIPPAALLGEMPAISLTAAETTRVEHGNPVVANRGTSARAGGLGTDDLPGDVPRFVRLLDLDGGLVAVGQARPDGLLHPVVVLG